MTSSHLTRRRLMQSGAVVAAAAGGWSPAFAEDVRLRVFWWGSKERAERTDKVNALYQQKNPGVTVAGESLGWTDYWPRLATQSAGRNAADLIQMDYRYIFEYARRGGLMALDPFVGKQLALNEFSQAAVDSGKVDGKIYGISLGLNSTAMIYDKTAIEAAGLKVPTWNMSWQEIGDFAVELTKATKKKDYFGIHDGGRYEPALEVFLRQRGRELYNEEGKLGFGEADIGDWFALWDGLRKRGGCATAEVQALEMGEIDTSLLTLGKSAMVLAHSNQLVGFQALSKGKLALSMYPSGGAGAKPGQYLKPSQLMSVYSRTKSPEAAAKLLDFFVNDLEAGRTLGVERGVPASNAVRKAIEPTLDELSKSMADYVAFVSDKVSALPPPPPQGAGEIQLVLRKVNEQIGFNRLSVADGAKQFMAEAKGVLARG
ncbi:ABC transporter substrate-binding protein [Terrarubrum flagellatum]|uniref:ABC transporter substrate-binding protein n=1 Tax=Terrirubrum flagellatum TaxID=2895980 RepID=UPI0031451258